MITIAAYSDTHTKHRNIPKLQTPVTIAIHTGDAFGFYHDIPQMRHAVDRFTCWFTSIPAQHHIYVPGNHDMAVCKYPHESIPILRAHGIHVLCDVEDWPDDVWNNIVPLSWHSNHDMSHMVELEGLKFWGSPATPEFRGWEFMHEHARLRQIWDGIPLDTEIVLTHGPAHGSLDTTLSGNNAGCRALKDRLSVVHPVLHIHGHIHESRGFVMSPSELWTVNASNMNMLGQMCPPTIIEIEKSLVSSDENEIVTDYQINMR